MRVRDLIEKLKQVDELLEVVVIDDTDDYRVLWIEDAAIDNIAGASNPYYRVVDLRFQEHRCPNEVSKVN